MKNPTIKIGFVWPGSAAWVPNANTILVRNENLATNQRLIAHELKHIKQARQLGMFFIPLYILRWVFAGFSYTNHPMERAARQAEDDHYYIQWAKEIIKEYKQNN